MDELDTSATELLGAYSAEETTIRAFRLTVIGGPDAGAVFVSTGDRVVVGTNESADFVLSDRTVSRFHCELAVDDTGVHLRDLDSRNGTRVDKVWIHEARLAGPVLLALGGTEVRFEEVSDEVKIPLTAGERLGSMVGGSTVMRAAFSLIERAALAEADILIEGEPGVGKALAATSIHELSPRREAAFGVVDCSEPENVVAHDLFGDEREPGALEICDGGTVVLEDVGALGENLQNELQRALDRGALQRADGTVKPFDTRMLSTSRRNIRRDVNARRFRTGLFTAIAEVRIRIPPLRERVSDIRLLVSAFLEELDAVDSPAARQLLSGPTMDALCGYSWPDNVRELKQYVERCVRRAQVIEPAADADPSEPPVIDSAIPLRAAREEWVRHFERRYLADLLERTGGNVSAAARRAGVDRVHMHRLLKAAGLR